MHRPVAVMVLILGLLAVGAPATAQSDTTPPTLHSLSISPNLIDTSQSDQAVTVTATITDDLSGVCAFGDSCFQTQLLLAPNRIQSPSTGNVFQPVTGDAYETTVTFPQFVAEGIWIVRVIVSDEAGNFKYLYQPALLKAGINVAVGVGSIESSYVRSISVENVSKSSVRGTVDASEYACLYAATVRLERKTDAGWKKLGKKTTRERCDFELRLKGVGRFRVVALKSDLGMPTITSCLGTAARFRTD